LVVQHTLDNGILVLLESLPYFRSASIGVWFKTGSVQEKEDQYGMAHFIEHMLFKGTKHRTARRIAEEIDAVGGQLNAFTAKEYTCFYTKVMDEHIPVAIDILGDLVCNPLFDEKDIRNEKNVITEEILMAEDTPEDVCHETLMSAALGSHPLSHPILGSQESIGAFTQDQIREFYEDHYAKGPCIISASGHFDETEMLQWLSDAFSGWKRHQSPYTTAVEPVTIVAHDRAAFRKKDIEQTHLCLAFPGVSVADDTLFPLLAVNTILGGGISSWLFQNIREEKGLAYEIYSYPSSYIGGGLLTIYAGTSPSAAETVLELIQKEVDRLRVKGLTDEELNRAKDQMKGNYFLGQESLSSRMSSLAKSQIHLGYVRTPQMVLNSIESITTRDIQNVIDRVFNSGQISLAVVAREEPRNHYSQYLGRS
jgi:predicted Zn-dependent peptidase